ncbi:MAG: glycosyltransferase [Bacteroidota bacterium]|nr:glycosyltransferase [Bacteroidota bacterium]
MSEQPREILFSFIIPVFNTGDFLIETLDSIINQNFDLSKIEIIIINDCSTDSNTITLINQLNATCVYKNKSIDVINNSQNMWLAETRNIGARKATGKYLVCLDSDDTIEPDFLLLSDLAFAAYPNASWVYPSVRKFGYKNKTDFAPDFSAKNLFLQNYLVAVSPLRRDMWLKLNGQKTIHIAQGIKLFEDWDFWQRAIGKGYFGVPIKKVIFNYRQNISSLITRSEDEGNLSTLLAYRKNWQSVFGIKKSQNNFNNHNFKYNIKNGLVYKIIRKISQLLLKRAPVNISIKDIFYFLFAPKLFIKSKASSDVKFTKAHKMAGFKQGFKLDFGHSTKVVNKLNQTVLCTHFWWHVGGAESILYDYLDVLKNHNYNVVDVVVNGNNEAKALKSKFASLSNQQYALCDVADGPYPQLLALWHIIKNEKPKVILNMSNPLLYILSPLIKEKFPNTVIYDLLHCEDFDDNGWFEAAYQFQDFIDRRIVTSDFWKEVLIKKYKERPSKIDVIYNMINYSAFTNNNFKRNELLIQNKIDCNKKIIGFIGRFQEQKKPDVFLKVVEKMQSNTDYHFVMAGQGEMLPEMLPLMNRLNNLTYIGSTTKPESVLPMFDIAVFPSKYEGYPLVGIEAAFVGLPIIASNIVGFREQIQNGNFGKLYDVKGDEDDSDAIKFLLLNHYNEILELGKNGPSFVDKFHNREEIIHHISNVFKL